MRELYVLYGGILSFSRVTFNPPLHLTVTSEAYLSYLRIDMENGKYPLFRDAIERILNYGVTIEQETFLNE